VSPGETFTAAIRYDRTAGTIAGSVNGAAVVSDTGRTVPEATEFRVGSSGGGAGQQFNDPVAALVYFPRAVSDAELQELSNA
jgi:hypothetical protein